ncbi:hypothetical protein H112_01088 [Trichophyton rubrum D6]|uniref:Uncharacterized protein n=2 Tax=Trichophyton rubrum TaxID=5551 RepID=F2SY53_TRIRC|nr:uncharacterized protein TERG_07511 [Trichophyton rubrum CBS 118892]EZF26912.1 hypothetical protein H100_01087 [Trichophyton rubrum MR850]EZF56584.1 hypothetical protein H103_01085 [Trichophyton rubrum CBS 288.86]EZF88399.1 hypothetical protein H110_01088 [Trichophyton rubrum MR1448]EZF99211.1 hypothetical protein H113_01089 [Trichophyton rubrum MR1459]EZG10402.1 hypothetical protein H106_00886 [Trichophyton rubrum CBS 735.88]EZG20830.1 hypothetical protein H107_01137 [Trichophyton rubrum C
MASNDTERGQIWQGIISKELKIIPGDTEESVARSLQTTEFVFDRSQRVCGNQDGVGLLQELRGLRKRVEESEKALEETKSESQRAYDASIMTMMELRAPIHQLHSGHKVGPSQRAKRNAVTHGGSILMDITILRHLLSNRGRTTVFTKWAAGFEDIYGIPFRYVETLSEGSKMVPVLNIYADILLLHIYASYDESETIQKMCKVILRQWKIAVDSERDPEGIFDGEALLMMYNKIVELHGAAEP